MRYLGTPIPISARRIGRSRGAVTRGLDFADRERTTDSGTIERSNDGSNYSDGSSARALTWILPPCTDTPRLFVLCDILECWRASVAPGKDCLAPSMQTDVYKYSVYSVYILMYIRFLLLSLFVRRPMRRRDEEGRNANPLWNSSPLPTGAEGGGGGGGGRVGRCECARACTWIRASGRTGGEKFVSRRVAPICGASATLRGLRDNGKDSPPERTRMSHWSFVLFHANFPPVGDGARRVEVAPRWERRLTEGGGGSWSANTKERKELAR